MSNIGTCCLCDQMITHDFNSSEPSGVGIRPPLTTQFTHIDSTKAGMLNVQKSGQHEYEYVIPAVAKIDITHPEAAIDSQTLLEDAFRMPLKKVAHNDNRTQSICDVASTTVNNYCAQLGRGANPSVTHTLHSISNAATHAPDYSRLVVTLLNQGGLDQFSEQVIQKDGVAINSSGENIVDEKNAFAIFPNGLVAHHQCLWNAAEQQVKRPAGAFNQKNPYAPPDAHTKPGWFSPAWQPSGIWGAGETAFKIPFYIIPRSVQALFSTSRGKSEKQPRFKRNTQTNINPLFNPKQPVYAQPVNLKPTYYSAVDAEEGTYGGFDDVGGYIDIDAPKAEEATYGFIDGEDA